MYACKALLFIKKRSTNKIPYVPRLVNMFKYMDLGIEIIPNEMLNNYLNKKPKPIRLSIFFSKFQKNLN